VVLDLENKLGQAHRATVILAVAMIASVFIYAGIVELLPRLPPSSEPPAEPGRSSFSERFFGASLWPISWRWPGSAAARVGRSVSRTRGSRGSRP
jgi:hypothetical protein